MGLFLGVDGGGSTTVAILADKSGQVVGYGLGGTGNFQIDGIEPARAEVQKSISSALDNAGVDLSSVVSAYFGMAGADRLRDFKIVRNLLEPLIPPTIHWNFENDAILGLWAGTFDGVGVGVVCGTGTNVVGVNLQGKRVQIGGMGSLFGDYAGGSYIGERAIALSMRGVEGRGEPTSMYDAILEHYGIEHLLDLVDRIYDKENLKLGDLVSLVMNAASQGDQVAIDLLQEVGRELGISTNAAIRQLFHAQEQVKVVGVGSVFQEPKIAIMYDEFAKTLHDAEYGDIDIQIPTTEPAVGSIYGAAAQIGYSISDDFKARLEESARQYM